VFSTKNKLVLFYILMLVAHVSHVTEEVSGRFFLIEKLGGLTWFLTMNIILFAVILLVFVSVLNEKHWAYKLSTIYAIIMIINGIGHNVATIVSGRYYDGFAGGYTGISLIFIGLPLIYFLRKGLFEITE